MSSRSFAGIAVAALLMGCVTVPEFRALEREVSDLKGGGAGASAGRSSNVRVAELGSDVNELQEEVGRLRGAVEEARHTAQQALEEAQAARDAVARGANVGQADRRGGSSLAAGTALDPDLSPAAASLSAEVKGYEAAFREYRGGEYKTAIDRFRAFLQTHPSSDYADNALFWLGESYFKLGDHEQAVLAFDDVVKRYPEGNKVPDPNISEAT